MKNKASVRIRKYLQAMKAQGVPPRTLTVQDYARHLRLLWDGR